MHCSFAVNLSTSDVCLLLLQSETQTSTMDSNYGITLGVVRQLSSGQTPTNPVLQVINLRKVGTNSERYRVSISCIDADAAVAVHFI